MMMEDGREAMHRSLCGCVCDDALRQFQATGVDYVRTLWIRSVRSFKLVRSRSYYVRAALPGYQRDTVPHVIPWGARPRGFQHGGSIFLRIALFLRS